MALFMGLVVYIPTTANMTPSLHQCNLVPSIRSPSLEWRTFRNTDCALIEQCILAAGVRRLLRFDLAIANRGRGNIVMGRPEDNPGRFEYSPCHGHYHFLNFSHYYLVDAHNTTVAHGHKQSYCLRDSERNEPVPGEDRPGRFTCKQQGISAGHSDVYGRKLDCQWIDVTGVPAGVYWIVAVVFPMFNETTFDDNIARYRYEIHS
jgi:hypothetical protein